MTRILFALTIGLAGTAVLVWLGLWQVERLAWKQDILAAIDARIEAEPIPLPEVPDIAGRHLCAGGAFRRDRRR